ncbi:MAG: SurA N-terminal domain-containing protein [Pseudomonadota bacterium]
MAETKKPRYGMWIIVGLLFVGLLGFGTGGVGGNIRTVGTVGDKQITVAQYQQAINSQIRAFEQQVGAPVSFVQAQQFGLDRQALNGVVAQRALDNEASKLGISVGDERVREEVLQVPGFRGLDGDFDRETYRNALQRSGLSEQQFEANIREETARNLLQGAIVEGVGAPTVYAETLAKYIGETRGITWATLTADDLSTAIPEPTETDIQSYYDENPDAFTAPEAREISYAWLTPAMIQDQVQVDETAVRALYDERLSDFIRPERRLVERIVYGDQADVDAALAQLADDGATFEDLVDSRGLSLTDVDMGDVDQAALGDAGEAVFAAAPGDIVGPFDTPFGPALFRMNAVLAADETPFEEAEPALREELSAARAVRVIDDAREGISDLLAGGAQISDLVAQTEMQAGTISWSPEVQDDIAAYEAFRSAAAVVAEGDFPELIELADGGVFTLRLEGITPPAVIPLDDVRDDVVAAWTAAQTQAAIMAEVEAAAGALDATAGFETQGLTANTEAELTRRSFVEGTPPGFINRVFELAAGEVTTIDAATFGIVLRVDDITVPTTDDEAIADDLEALSQTATLGVAQDIFDIFNNAVQRDTEVSLNDQALTAVHSAFQ